MNTDDFSSNCNQSIIEHVIECLKLSKEKMIHEGKWHEEMTSEEWIKNTFEDLTVIEMDDE